MFQHFFSTAYFKSPETCLLYIFLVFRELSSYSINPDITKVWDEKGHQGVYERVTKFVPFSWVYEKGLLFSRSLWKWLPSLSPVPRVMKIETETLNNFCPSRFSQVCPSRFSFPPKRKSVQKVCLDFLVSNANLYSDEKIYTSTHTYGTNLCFEGNENLDTLEKI